MERSPQSFSLMMKEPYDGPWPPIKLNPEIMVRDNTAGSEAIRLSTRARIFSERSWEVPGGNVTAPISVPVSSLGTIPVGVVFMKNTSIAMEATTNPIDNHFFWIKNSTRFL